MKWLLNKLRDWLRQLLPNKRKPTPMEMTGKIWIDLTPIGGGPVFCDCDINSGSSIEVAEFNATIAGLSEELIRRLYDEKGLPWGEPTSGLLNDGREFGGCIRSITGYSPISVNTIEVKGALSDVTIKEPSRKQAFGWEFFLSNVQLSPADLWTDYPAEQRKAVDSIEFFAAGRKWRLTDTWQHKWQHTSKGELAKPILSGMLRTEFLPTDTEDLISEIVQDISDVLAISLSRSVNWLGYTLKASDGTALRQYRRSAWTTGFNKHGFRPVANHSPGSLKSLLESSLPIIASNREWYRRTLGLLSQAQLADMIDVRCSLLYTLADRISTFVVGKTKEAEIDKDLKSRARKPEFIAQLHQVLRQLSPSNWSQSHTNAVLIEIKRWNSMPSFVVKIQRACANLGLPEPDKELLRPRNPLLHDGEMVPADDDNLAHYFELDWVVLTLVLRLFGYTGTYYHRRFGTEPVELAAQLVDAKLPDGGDVPGNERTMP